MPGGAIVRDRGGRQCHETSGYDICHMAVVVNRFTFTRPLLSNESPCRNWVSDSSFGPSWTLSSHPEPFRRLCWRGYGKGGVTLYLSEFEMFSESTGRARTVPLALSSEILPIVLPGFDRASVSHWVVQFEARMLFCQAGQ